jgi:uncharacterized membrane protein YeaQ/YmgE (transglycosylase-associated protein family)
VLILFVIVWGMAAGYLAHLILERHRRPDWTLLFLAGIGGSLLGGLVLSLLVGDGLRLRLSGIVGSVLGALLILGIVESRRQKIEQARKAAQKQPRKSGAGRAQPKKH